MESFEAMFNENVEVDVEVNEKNISSNNVEEDKLNDEPERPNKKARDLSFTMWIFLKNMLNILMGNQGPNANIVRKTLWVVGVKVES